MWSVNSFSMQQLFGAVADLGRSYFQRPSDNQQTALGSIEWLCRELLSHRGEASGTALAREVAQAITAMSGAERLAFLELLADGFAPDPAALSAAARAYLDEPSAATCLALSMATESPRQALLRRLNVAPGGTAAIVDLRADLLKAVHERSPLVPVASDFQHILESWFNRGFLEFRQIDWNTPAVILEKLIAHEAVHAICGWDDLRRRLTDDRRCYAYFHPALPDEPLIFVEVALTRGLATEIAPLLTVVAHERQAEDADTAVFYSISNCQAGLDGISFGNFLIKQVVDHLSATLPHLKTFATLSPIPGLGAWLAALSGREPAAVPAAALTLIDQGAWPDDATAAQLEAALVPLCARYLVQERRDGQSADPVARFHLGNGARIERINWAADRSPPALKTSAGLMVNYLYDAAHIVANHEAYSSRGEVATSSRVRKLLAAR